MKAFFDIIPEAPADTRLWRCISHLSWKFGRHGKCPPVTDLVITASALRTNSRLVSPDAHFEDISGH